MISIYEASILDLLPPNLKSDADVIAAAKAVDNEFLLIVNEVKECILLPKIDDIDNSDLIDLLAWQMHVDFYDNTLPIDIRRNLVKNSIKWHRIKGTPQAVIDVATSVFGRTKLTEWFEYGADPYYFKLDVNVTEQGASPENIKKIETLVNAYKNKRSWIDIINIFFSTQCNVYFGATSITGEQIITYPWTPSNIEDTVDVKIAIAQVAGNETITIYPKEAI
ncbi:phage tail protein I [Clostridium sp.]|uniref:phage tail protein I n=1 Tax=Clostridium sp. TaxID=1506 RepID=UPI0026289BF8|nr:phage tail protein I [Clostridium sp.]